MVTLADAKEVSDILISGLKPLSVVLFGSVAKEGRGADLDLLIIVDDTEQDEDRSMTVHRILKNYYKKFNIDPFVVPFSRFVHHYSKGSPFLRGILKEGRLIYMKDAVIQWVKQAEDERDMAAYLLQGKFFKGACYHAQQSVEKAVKALLLNKGWELEKTHSVERLVSIAETYGISVTIPEEDVVFLDIIYRGRYPIEAGLLPIGEPSESHAQKAVGIAERTLGEAKRTLNLN